MGLSHPWGTTKGGAGSPPCAWGTTGAQVLWERARLSPRATGRDTGSPVLCRKPPRRCQHVPVRCELLGRDVAAVACPPGETQGTTSRETNSPLLALRATDFYPAPQSDPKVDSQTLGVEATCRGI